MPFKKFITITGCRGSGKSAIVRLLVRQSHNTQQLVSNTTRPRRRDDVDGEYRHFSVEDFCEQRDNGLIAWWAEYDGHYYWTLFSDIESALAYAGYTFAILVPETVPKLMALAPNRVLPIWVTPAPREQHQQRLEKRGDSPAKILAALAEANNWAPSADVGYQLLCNCGELPHTLSELGKICQAEDLNILPRV